MENNIEQTNNIEPTETTEQDNINDVDSLSEDEIGDMFNQLIGSSDEPVIEESNKISFVEKNKEPNVGEPIEEDNPTDDNPTDDTNTNDTNINDNNDDYDESGDDSSTEKEPTGATEHIEDKLADSDKEDETEPTEDEVQQLIAEFNKYKEFFDKASSIDFGGTKINFDDPDLLRKTAKLGIANTRKYDELKKYIPYVKALEENGLTDPVKLQTAIDAVKGNKNALLHLLKNSGIDIEELDLDEEVEYNPEPQLPSQELVELEDFVKTAEVLGYGEKIKDELQKWDNDSVIELVKKPEIKEELILHMDSGVYDIIAQRIAAREAIDLTGSFRNRPFFDKYREEAARLEEELIQQMNYLSKTEEFNEEQQSNNAEENTNNHNNKEQKSNNIEFTEEDIKKEIERIKKELEYKSKVEENKVKISKTRVKTTPEPKQNNLDINNIPDEKIEEIFSNLLNS